MPAGFAPFGIQAINGDIYVSHAEQGAGEDEEHGLYGRIDVDMTANSGRHGDKQHGEPLLTPHQFDV